MAGSPTAARAASKKKSLSPLPEKNWQAQITQLARLFGWRTYHVFDSRRSEAGFPDLVLVRRPRVIFAELKKDGKNPTVIQQAWLDELKACGQETYCWRPADLEEIVRVLR